MKVWIKIIFRIEEFTLVWLTEWCQYLTIAFGRCRKEAKWTVSQCNRGHRTAVLVHNIAPYLVCTQVGATWWVGGCRSMSKSLSCESKGMMSDKQQRDRQDWQVSKGNLVILQIQHLGASKRVQVQDQERERGQSQKFDESQNENNSSPDAFCCL